MFCEAYRATGSWMLNGDEVLDRLLKVVELSSALQATSEIGRESLSQGAEFMDIALAVWSSERMQAVADFTKRNDVRPSHAVAVAIVSALHDLSLEASLTAHLHAFAANLVSAGIRLIPLGQTDGQRAIAALEPIILKEAGDAMTRDFADIGSATPMVDWTSMKHQTQYTRLFRS